MYIATDIFYNSDYRSSNNNNNINNNTIFLVLTKTGTQLEPPGTGRNQLELAENHLEPPVYISGISWNHQTRVKNQLLSWNQQWFHILIYLNFCKTKIRT